ncbi:nitrophenyl compound nitroreductase subunit ArsF family protein [Crateriforma conspicua]|uniref:nitrophenyl compound nitroreductase subunit ArsF family protein n=1 Tax=Crateriforma conspicua TaxID=2527996 RepID=UPI00118C4718|nr:nitrophenyl compound nitroreductase subunit ArsF family protein [Crateriforma conspicua]QDV63856.1 hypothetical protein Mal65_30030 [Crateriforma conspicua]
MDLKNALGVCVISFFAATLVMLIARTMDNQAAGRIEQQLTRIADQLETLQSASSVESRLPAVATHDSNAPVISDALVVHYFFSNTRCVTCRAIEEQTRKVLMHRFAAQLDNGDVFWNTLNYEDPDNAEWADRFEIMMPVVVLAKYQNGEIVDWKRLDEVWGRVGDTDGFEHLIVDQVERMLSKTMETPVSEQATEIPLPDMKTKKTES